MSQTIKAIAARRNANILHQTDVAISSSCSTGNASPYLPEARVRRAIALDRPDRKRPTSIRIPQTRDADCELSNDYFYQVAPSFSKPVPVTVKSNAQKYLRQNRTILNL